MGFLDAIKRWRLARQGLSSGKKRRVHAESVTMQSLEFSVWVRFALYATFAVGTAVLVLRSAQNSIFSADPLMGTVCGFVLALTAVAMFHVGREASCRRNSRVVLVLGGMLGHLAIVRLTIVLLAGESMPEMYRLLLIPFALAPMLHGVLLGRSVGAFSAVYVSLVGALFVPSNQTVLFLVTSLVCGMTAVIFTSRVFKRVQLLRAGCSVGIAALVLAILFRQIDPFAPMEMQLVMDQLQVFGLGCAAALGTGIMTALLVGGLLPVFESIFKLTTGITWLELSDLNHKLLRRMQLEAPGTFHHSLVVASLAEAAAESIGANAQLCRVCSYFHDVGKLKKPEYFIENQHDGAENPHDSLTPTMSALVIIAHVKDGVDLAVKHKLNPRIIDVIQEHHGDSLVYYFYRKAQEQKRAEMEKVEKGLGNREDLPHVEEKNFRYPGPKPRTAESGIISLADSIESASRTLRKPTPAKIRAMIDDIVQARIADGQLDECMMSCRELAKVKESFANTLRSMLHSRIDYPEDKADKGTSGGTTASRRVDTHRLVAPPLDRDATRGGRSFRPDEAA
ncbi:HDIG domain-containing protein [Luteolibacter ambystomatis]|uniref:HDIG domain-containing protein n=1 Tax=Luteolibacter ambystomatis TaxID=2824561 RepID=A0A975G627_9BACT|nr:HDIG domain-containing metalloprotein [Luteolibacter ambystomatis]QUE49638.1 HDIG domain-containing protein [Luteolibacter ambystomatis]